MSLEIQLLLTEKCNFRCEYCYLSFKDTRLTKKKFSDFYNTKLKECLKVYGEDKYYIVFFGGEPLLEQRLILDIYDIVKDDPLCEYMKVVTNGALLTKELAEEYINMGIRLSISYDGIWQGENRSDQIPDNSILKSPIQFKNYVTKTHCMVRPENINTITDNFEYFVGIGINPDFKLVDDDIWNDEDVDRFRLSLDRLMKSNINTIVSLGKPIVAGFFTHWMVNILKPTNSMCSLGSGVTLHPNGNIYPCSRFANKKEFPIWDKTWKDFDWGINEEIVYHMKEFSNMETWGICHKCEISKYCRGGCPYVQLNRGGVVPQLCEMYKILFKKTNEFIEKCERNPILLKCIEDLMREI